MKLMNDIGDRIINPFEHPIAYGMTLFMELFLKMIYWSFRLIRKREDTLTRTIKLVSLSRCISQYNPVIPKYTY
jgi:hypothetical protein